MTTTFKSRKIDAGMELILQGGALGIEIAQVQRIDSLLFSQLFYVKKRDGSLSQVKQKLFFSTH